MRGRPTSYKPEYARQVEGLCKLGATVADIAFGVAVSTVSLWMVKHPEFSEAIKRGRLVADMAVVEALYNSAIGFTYKAEAAVNGRVSHGRKYLAELREIIGK